MLSCARSEPNATPVRSGNLRVGQVGVARVERQKPPDLRVPRPSRTSRRAGTTSAYTTGSVETGSVERTKVALAASPPTLAKTQGWATLREDDAMRRWATRLVNLDSGVPDVTWVPVSVSLALAHEQTDRKKCACRHWPMGIFKNAGILGDSSHHSDAHSDDVHGRCRHGDDVGMAGIALRPICSSRSDHIGRGARNGKAVSVGGYTCSIVPIQRRHARMADTKSWMA